MIVKYIGEPEPYSNFTLNKSYIVLHICHNGYQFLVTVRGDHEKRPNFTGLQYFNIVDPTIPNDWIIEGEGENFYRFAPKAFGKFEDDFFGLCYSDDPQALQTLEKVYRELQLFHGIEPDPIKEEPVKPENPFAWSDKWLHDEE